MTLVSLYVSTILSLIEDLAITLENRLCCIYGLVLLLSHKVVYHVVFLCLLAQWPTSGNFKWTYCLNKLEIAYIKQQQISFWKIYVDLFKWISL